MTIRLDELNGWKRIAQGDVLKLPGDHEDVRRVRVHLNVEDRTWLYVDHIEKPDDDPQYLATVGPGCETVEFFARGDLLVSFSVDAPEGKGQVWVSTAELEPNVEPNPNAVSFTEYMERRARNPELEMMQLIARQNERRMEGLMAEQRALLDEVRAERKANDDQKPPAGDQGGNGKTPEGGSEGLPPGDGAGDGDGSAGAGGGSA